MSSKASEKINANENNEGIIYKRQSKEEFLMRFHKFKAFYVNNNQLNNDISNRNTEIFKP